VEKVERNCSECGKPSHGFRCRSCHGKFERQRGLDFSEKRDREVVGMADDGMPGRRIAIRLGVSPARASQLVRIARQREELRRAKRD
jgi:transposase-like protein